MEKVFVFSVYLKNGESHKGHSNIDNEPKVCNYSYFSKTKTGFKRQIIPQTKNHIMQKDCSFFFVYVHSCLSVGLFVGYFRHFDLPDAVAFYVITLFKHFVKF